MEMVRVARTNDFPGWLRLAKEVEPLFGPMVGNPAFCEALKQAILQESAFCYSESGCDGRQEKFLGGIAISRATNEIVWLAVARGSRGRGIGAALVSEVLKHFDPRRPISVTTFDEAVEAGVAARRLYHSFGFRDSLKAGSNPAGIPIVTMTRE